MNKTDMYHELPRHPHRLLDEGIRAMLTSGLACIYTSFLHRSVAALLSAGRCWVESTPVKHLSLSVCSGNDSCPLVKLLCPVSVSCIMSWQSDTGSICTSLQEDETVWDVFNRKCQRRLCSVRLLQKNVLQGEQRDHVWNREGFYAVVLFFTIFVIIITCLMVM